MSLRTIDFDDPIDEVGLAASMCNPTCKKVSANCNNLRDTLSLCSNLSAEH